MAIGNVNNVGAYNETAKTVQAPKVNTDSLSHVATSTNINTQDNYQNEDVHTNNKALVSKIKATIAEANLKATRTRCEFSVDEATKRIAIKVIDIHSDEVIAEIPPEESLDVLAKIWELAGLLVDEKR